MNIELLAGTLESALEGRLRKLLDLAFEGDFSAEDWEHTHGGSRFIGALADEVIAHGAVVPRRMWLDGKEMIVGYVEAIAVAPQHWRKGFGSNLMEAITRHCQDTFELSMLSTDEKEFYRRYGWRDFPGSSQILIEGEVTRSADEDEGLMYLSSGSIVLSTASTILCEARSGDAW